MNKAKELLDELQNLDLDIQSRIDEINELEAGLLSSPKWNTDKVNGGQIRHIDDVYTQLVVMKEAIEQDTNEVISRKIKLGRLINKLKKPQSRTLLRMMYINKIPVYEIMEHFDCSRTTLYSKRKQAIVELSEIIEKLEQN
ncbi:DUF1492 domain-containing protein [Streptococcus uberis]